MARPVYRIQAPDTSNLATKKCSPCSCLLCPWHAAACCLLLATIFPACCCLPPRAQWSCTLGEMSSWIVFETSAPLSTVQWLSRHSLDIIYTLLLTLIRTQTQILTPILQIYKSPLWQIVSSNAALRWESYKRRQFVQFGPNILLLWVEYHVISCSSPASRSCITPYQWGFNISRAFSIIPVLACASTRCVPVVSPSTEHGQIIQKPDMQTAAAWSSSNPSPAWLSIISGRYSRSVAFRAVI